MPEHWPQGALIVLGASEEHIPLYQEARRRQIPTIAVDMRSDAPAFPFADSALHISTRNVDAIIEALGEVRPVGVVCGASDAALPTWHALSMRFNAPYVYPKSALVAGDKAAFHAVAESCGVTRYGWTASDDPDKVITEAAEMPFPLMIKPLDGSGSKGVTRITHADELPAAVASARALSPSQTVIAEEFVQGRPLVIEMFMQHGQAKFISIHDEEFATPGYAIKRLRTPARLPAEARDQVETIAERLCLALGVTDGPADFDMVLGTDGRARVIEANPRIGGEGLPKLLAAAYGVDNVRALIALVLGEPFGAYLTPTHHRHAAVEVIGSPLNVNGELVRWEGVTEARAVPGVSELTLYAEPGDLVRPPDQAGHKIGLICVAGQSPEEADASLKKASALIRPVVRPITPKEES